MLEGSLRSKVCDQIEHIEPGQLSQIYWILRSDTLLSFIINHLLAKSGAKHFDQYPVLLCFFGGCCDHLLEGDSRCLALFDVMEHVDLSQHEPDPNPQMAGWPFHFMVLA